MPPVRTDLHSDRSDVLVVCTEDDDAASCTASSRAQEVAAR